MLAIVIPYFKLAFFEETLWSLTRQTNKNFRVYIGDDASPENPKNVINGFVHDLDLVYKKFENNLGKKNLTKHWERCIYLTQEEDWIMILGDDDMLDNNVVSCFYASLQEFCNSTNIVRFSSSILFEESQIKSEVFKNPKWESADDAFIRRFQGLTRSSLSEYIFSKNAFLKYRFQPYELAWHSDDRAWLEFSDGKPIYSINEAEVIFRLSNHNITGRSDNELQKKKASLDFYKYLAQQKKLFSFDQRLLFARIFERGIRDNRPLTLMEWYVIFKIYFRNCNRREFWKLVKRFVKEKIINQKVEV